MSMSVQLFTSISIDVRLENYMHILGVPVIFCSFSFANFVSLFHVLAKYFSFLTKPRLFIVFQRILTLTLKKVKPLNLVYYYISKYQQVTQYFVEPTTRDKRSISSQNQLVLYKTFGNCSNACVNILVGLHVWNGKYILLKVLELFLCFQLSWFAGKILALKSKIMILDMLWGKLPYCMKRIRMKKLLLLWKACHHIHWIRYTLSFQLTCLLTVYPIHFALYMLSIQGCLLRYGRIWFIYLCLLQ